MTLINRFVYFNLQYKKNSLKVTSLIAQVLHSQELTNKILKNLWISNWQKVKISQRNIFISVKTIYYFIDKAEERVSSQPLNSAQSNSNPSEPGTNKQNIEETVNQQLAKGDNKSKKYFYQFQNNILFYWKSRRASVIQTLKLGKRHKRASPFN